MLAVEVSAGQQTQADAALLKGELAGVKSALATASDQLTSERAAGVLPFALSIPCGGEVCPRHRIGPAHLLSAQQVRCASACPYSRLLGRGGPGSLSRCPCSRLAVGGRWAGFLTCLCSRLEVGGKGGLPSRPAFARDWRWGRCLKVHHPAT